MQNPDSSGLCISCTSNLNPYLTFFQVIEDHDDLDSSRF